MDSIQAYLESPQHATGYMACLICRRVQGWVTSPLMADLRASEFIPAPDYPNDPPSSGQLIECAWCFGPAAPTPTVLNYRYHDKVGWRVLVDV